MRETVIVQILRGEVGLMVSPDKSHMTQLVEAFLNCNNYNSIMLHFSSCGMSASITLCTRDTWILQHSISIRTNYQINKLPSSFRSLLINSSFFSFTVPGLSCTSAMSFLSTFSSPAEGLSFEKTLSSFCNDSSNVSWSCPAVISTKSYNIVFFM